MYLESLDQFLLTEFVMDERTRAHRTLKVHQGKADETSPFQDCENFEDEMPGRLAQCEPEQEPSHRGCCSKILLSNVYRYLYNNYLCLSTTE